MSPSEPTGPITFAEQFRTSWRILPTVFVLLISLPTVLATALGEWPQKLAAGVSGESGLMPGALPVQHLTAMAVILSIPIVLSPWMVLGTGYGVALPSPPRRAARFLQATSLTWLAMSIVGLSNPWIRQWVGEGGPWSGISASREVADGQMVWLALNAGYTEEVVSVAIPVGLTYFVIGLLNLVVERRGKTVMPPASIWKVAVIVGVGFGLIERTIGHLYQGYTSAVLALVWGAVVGMVFYWFKSIWPIMIAHFIYDLPVHPDTWTGQLGYALGVPLLLLGLSLWLLRSRHGAAATSVLRGP